MRQKTGKFFEVVVAYEKVMEDGLAKKVGEKVVVEAFSCGEAEKRAMEELTTASCGGMECLEAVVAPYTEIFIADEGDIFYKAKVRLTTLCENGKEKKVNMYYLTNANSIEGARRNVEEAYSGSMSDYAIASLSETKITEVYEKE